MAKYFRKNFRRYARRKAPYRRARPIKKPSRFLKKVIQTMIAKNIEDKEAYHTTGNSLISFNSGINTGADIQKVLPNISAGTSENGRIGDRIRAKSLVIKGYLQMYVATDVNTISNKRIGVRLMVLSSKKYKQWDDFASGGWLGATLKKGATQTAFEGQIQDLFAPLNTEEVTKMYDKVFYLSQEYIRQQIGSSTPTTEFAVDNRKGIAFFTIRLPVRGKVLHYDASSGGGVQPTNWTCGLCLGYAHLDGSSPDTVSTQVGLCYDSYFEYEDA